MNFSVKSLPSEETLGDKLRKARKAKGVDIKHVEEATKIRAKHIEALETGNYSELPPDVYIEGFLKIYAEFLGLEKEKILQLYKKERELKETVEKAVRSSFKKTVPMNPKIVITPKTLFLSAIMVTVLVIVIYIGWQIKILTAPPKLEVITPSDNASFETDVIFIEGKTDEGADLFINDIQIGVGSEGKFKSRISLQDGTNVITITAKNRMGKVTKITRNVVTKLLPVQVAVEENKGVELKVSAGPNSTWIYVEVDGVPVEKEGIVMLSGSSRVFRGKEKIVISSKNAGSANITFNGKDIGSLGKEGKAVKNREFTKDMQVR